LVASFSACGPRTGVSVDGGTNDAAPIATDRSLSFASTESLQLAPGARVPIAVALRDSRTGEPIVDEEVRFALVRGDARDATLSETAVFTGDASDAGIARTSLLGSSDTATFWIRASANRASDAYLFVAVSARGFGGIAITANYQGPRGPQSLQLDLFGELDCAHLAGAEPIRTVPLPSAGGIASIAGLPAGESFAVRGTALGSSGVIVASGCVDHVTVMRDDTVSRSIPFADRPLTLDGTYDLTMQLDLGVVPAIAGVTWTTAVESEVASHGTEADYLLDAVASAVGLPHTPARDSFDSARDTLRATVDGFYATRGISPSRALADLAADVSLAAENVRLAVSADATPDGSLTLHGGRLSVDPLTPDVSTDDRTTVVTVSGSGHVVASSDDRAAFSIQALDISYPVVARATQATLLNRLGVTSTADWVGVSAHCADLAMPIAQVTAASCDAGCVTMACNAAMSQLAAVFDNAVGSAGSQHGAIDLRFEGPVHGVPATLRIEVLDDSPLAGAFEDDPALVVLGSVRMILQPPR
jgi:hypothetical protein